MAGITGWQRTRAWLSAIAHLRCACLFSCQGALDFKGGETAALARLQYYLFESNLIATYFDSRNGMLGELGRQADGCACLNEAQAGWQPGLAVQSCWTQQISSSRYQAADLQQRVCPTHIPARASSAPPAAPPVRRRLLHTACPVPACHQVH